MRKILVIILLGIALLFMVNAKEYKVIHCPGTKCLFWAFDTTRNDSIDTIRMPSIAEIFIGDSLECIIEFRDSLNYDKEYIDLLIKRLQ